jgi:hypothetical protein
MTLSERDQAVFQDLTGRLETDRAHRQRPDDGKRPTVALLATAVAGIAALPAAIAMGLDWAGLVGFLAAVAATARLLAQVPRPNRDRLRAQGLLPTVACVERRSYDGTMVTRRTFILPGRLIILLIIVILLPLVVTTRITQPERPPTSRELQQPRFDE